MKVLNPSPSEFRNQLDTFLILITISPFFISSKFFISSVSTWSNPSHKILPFFRFYMEQSFPHCTPASPKMGIELHEGR
jgi:hypothetical protein